MLFNTWQFWAFLAVVLPVYWALPFRWQNRFLILASYYFYGCWNWKFLPLIAGSTLMDYALGMAVARAPSRTARRRLVAISVVVNLALLGFFKYYGFFAHEVSGFFARLGFPLALPIWSIVLPVGISFYTFQSMSYVIDISRGVSQPADNFWDFALYVCFFPHLVAGPIMRSGNSVNGKGLLKQLQSARLLSRRGLSRGPLPRGSRALQESRDRRQHGDLRQRDFPHAAGPADRAGMSGGGLRVRPADLRGLFGLQLHRPGCGEMDGHRPDGQFPAAVFRGESERLLAALAHQPLDVAPRLRLHFGRRKPRRRVHDLPQSAAGHGAAEGSGTGRTGRSSHGACSTGFCSARTGSSTVPGGTRPSRATPGTKAQPAHSFSSSSFASGGWSFGRTR